MTPSPPTPGPSTRRICAPSSNASSGSRRRRRRSADDIKDVYAEAKGNGFDVKIIRKIVSIRKQDRDKRREEEEILELYLAALGMG